MKYTYDPSRRGRFTVLASAALLLAACGGGGGSPASAPSIQGTVASGNAVAQAAITATDVNGKTATATADSNGNYTLVTSGLTAPIALVAADPSGQVSPVVSVLATLPAAGKIAVANITTLTTALSALLTPDGNPMDFVTASAATSLSKVTTAGTQAATTTLDTYLANLLSATGLPATFDPVGTAFTANHTGADALIDLLSIVPEGGATYLTYVVPSTATTQSAAYLALDSASVGASNLPVTPAISAGAAANLASLATYLGSLSTALQPCLAAGGTGSACSSVIDASYKDNGYTNITQYDSGFTSSTLSLGTPTTVTAASDGTSALIAIPYALTSAAGNLGQYTAYTTVHQTPGGSWDIIGNQLNYDVSVATRTTWRHFNDTFTNSDGNPDVSFFDAGVTLDVNLTGPGGSSINSAYVTGPGLPGAGLWLTISEVTGTHYLAIEATQQSTMAPPSSTYETGSDTNEYRWSSATLTGDPAFIPPSAGFWSSSNLDVTQLPPGRVYQFTLYDVNGSQVAQLNVTNPNPPADATLGENAYTEGQSKTYPQGSWPTLGSDVVTNFLSASGSLAAAQTSVPVDFKPPPAVTPNMVQLTMSEITVYSQAQNGTGYQRSISVQNGTTSVTVTAASGDSFQAINNSSNSAYRIVQLQSKNAQGILFYLNETYRSSANAPNAS